MHAESHPANGYATPIHRIVVAVDGSDATWHRLRSNDAIS